VKLSTGCSVGLSAGCLWISGNPIGTDEVVTPSGGRFDSNSPVGGKFETIG
jgi:hypothetical protein